MYFESFSLVLKMIILIWIFIGSLFTGVACDTEQNWIATVGENITIPFKTAEQEKANRVTIIFLKEKTVIAQYCRCAHCEDCDVVKKPGVLLKVEEGTVLLILLDVSIRSSGTYEARIYIGNNVFKETGSLLVNEPFSPSRQPPHTSTSKPHNSSEHQWLYLAIIITTTMILAIVICGVVCFIRKPMRASMAYIYALSDEYE
ncbi:uncharacterized protein LOC127159052 [Labeo rohita]|uniref:uncharacterized protein LOC127159052 n=1 Tax=Labeo rohita TaxID=84645 RepID=UPI0021E32CAE|nr:uncharacterized protein LOC127159052 [Labeo rohita]